jgi:serine/threonine protein kinase
LADTPKPRASHLEPGSTFAGYRIERVLDRGGMGVVYKAVDEDLDRQIALKIIAPEHSQNETAVARFKAECRLAASIEHPNIVPIHRGGESEGVLYLAMRFVPGTNLRAVIDQGPMELPRIASIVSQVAAALDAAHDRGLIHRDVKPANILISGTDAEPQVFLTDFGLTKRLGSAGDLTREGNWVGTPDYVAPEQIQGHKVDRRADVYSLGCVLFEMLTGRVAYVKDSDMAKLWAHVSDPPPLPRTVRPELPKAFDDIVGRATAKEPDRRYATAGDLGMAVREAVGRQEGRERASAASVATPVVAPFATRDEAFVGDEETVVHAPPPSTPPPPPPPPPRPAAASPPPPPPPPRGAVAPVPVDAPDAPRAAAPKRAARSRGGGSRDGSALKRRAKPLAVLALLLVVVVAAVLLTGSGGSKDKVAGQRVDASLGPVPTNRVTGKGSAVMHLDGNLLTISIDTSGLLDGAPHAVHIHAGRKGICPTAAAATEHNGHLSIATLAGVPFYGPPVAALTTTGDTSPKSITAFSRYPKTSDIDYRRTIKVTPVVAAYIRKDNAVLVVHGIDYNHNGVYDGVLERSDLDRSLTGESTSPALCGPLVADKASAPSGTKTASVADTTYTASLTLAPAAASADPAPTGPGTPDALICPLLAGILPGSRQA